MIIFYQLTVADYNNGSQNRYDYDPLGNRTMLSNGSQTTYESNKLNQYERVGGVSYSYDKNGNLTFDGTYSYVYDCENRLIEVKQGETTIVSYAYDFKGRRVRKTVNGGQTTKFCYDGDQIIADYNDSGVLLAKYVYGPGIDEPIYLSTGGNGYYYFFDGLGSVVALARNGYAPTEVYSYDVFGEPNRVSSIGNRYMFTGREFEPETGLYYYRARYYHTAIGRFLQTDPMGYNAELNLYTYCKNNPIKYVDPYGEHPENRWCHYGCAIAMGIEAAACSLIPNTHFCWKAACLAAVAIAYRECNWLCDGPKPPRPPRPPSPPNAPPGYDPGEPPIYP